MKRWMTKGLVLFSVFVPPAVNSTAQAVTDYTYTKDSRFHRLRSFFQRRHCPAERYVSDFLQAADRHRLDWRLLPSIALIESSGGKWYVNNNIFGWNSSKQKFSSIQAGIHLVADRLANAPVYRGKDVDGVLKTYNCRPHYGIAVKRVMQQLAAEPI